MKTLDRYILRQFATNFVILFLVMTMLVVTLDLIVNFDEFVKAGQQVEGNWLTHLVATLAAVADFYGPHALLFYVYLSGLLPVAAAGFTLASMHRNRELIAMMAGGISLYRIAMPILLAGFIAAGLLFVDQQFVLPSLAEKLSRGHADMQYGYRRPFPVHFVPDSNGSLWTAGSFDTRTSTMTQLTILRREMLEPGVFSRAVERITADQATWDDASSGWQLINGYSVRRQSPEQDVTAAVSGSGAPATLDQAVEVQFISTDLDPTTLRLHRDAKFRELLSVQQLTALMRKGRTVDVRELQQILHSRFSLVVMNVLVLVMGLPYFLLRAPANLLLQTVKAAVLCLGAWLGGFIMLQIGPGLLPPAVIAWLPVVIYTPVAFFLLDRVET
jgi:lipopolysaccharide export system permease protein